MAGVLGIGGTQQAEGSVRFSDSFEGWQKSLGEGGEIIIFFF